MLEPCYQGRLVTRPSLITFDKMCLLLCHLLCHLLCLFVVSFVVPFVVSLCCVFCCVILLCLFVVSNVVSFFVFFCYCHTEFHVCNRDMRGSLPARNGVLLSLMFRMLFRT